MCPYENCHHNHPELPQHGTGQAAGAAPRARWRAVVTDLAVAGTYISAAAFFFCVVASVAYGWHRAVTKPGIAVSVIALAACVAAVYLAAGDGE